MIKIRISYDREQDAQRVIKLLSSVISEARIKRSESGKYKKIYIDGGRVSES